MELDTVAIQSIYALATVMSLSFAGILWRNREKRGAKPLFVTALGISLWSGMLLARSLTGPQLAPALIYLMYLGISINTPAIFLFALEYTGRERYITRTTIGLLSIHPVVLMALMVTDFKDLIFTELVREPRPATQSFASGPLYDLHLLYSYGLIIATVILILAFVLRTNRTMYRGQAVALILGVFAPLPTNAVFVFWEVNFDSTPIGFVATFSLLTVATVKYDLINVAPIAREKVIENVRDGMVVVDTRNRIVDSNPAGRQMLGVDTQESLVGQSIEDLFAEIPEIVSDFQSLTETVEPTERTVSYGDTYLHVSASPLRDDRDRHVGWVILLQDVTERKRRERDLEQQIEKLDQFASIVSHDLRNPLNVARGYVQQVKATGDMEHLDKTEEAMERMEDIIDDALALAREGQEVTEPEDVSIATVAREAWDHVDTDAATLEIETDETIVADPDRLQRLFENLFRNAIEHGTDGTTDEPFTVRVGVTDETATELTLYVADNGVGIPDEKLETVFEGGYSTNDDGTGLGLSIVQQIATAHGWSIAAQHSEDGGARFEMSGIGRVRNA